MIDQSAKTLRQFVENLTVEEKQFLQSLLFEPDQLFQKNYAVLSSVELLNSEAWLWERVQAAPTPKIKHARIRSYAIFIFLRYAGLRLYEIFNLTPKNIDLTNACITIDHGSKRTIYLPTTIARRLATLLTPEHFLFDNPTPLQTDAASIRHLFLNCAKACNIPKGMLNATNLRYARAHELKKAGADLKAIHYFLGIWKSNPNDELSLAIRLKQCCQMETQLQTSARNVFQGRVQEIDYSGLMVRVKFKTASGLLISALITDQSCQRLQITIGTIVTASIKAPWITMQPIDKITPSSSSTENCFIATINSVRGDQLLYEITATLDEGSLVCALQGTSLWQPKVGEKVLIFIKALAVVLNTNLS